MRVFLDTNFLIYTWVPSEHRDACLEVLDAAVEKRLEAETSVAVLEEVWHLELSGRAGELTGLTRRLHTILAPLLVVDDAVFTAALALEAPALGANDRLHAAVALAHGIGSIVSADRGFDQVPGLERFDPLDRVSLRKLLTA